MLKLIFLKNKNMLTLIDYESESQVQDANDLIAVFCGGVLEINPVMGEMYRFDDPGTFQHIMKCPPFGKISRSGMTYHCNYNWLIPAIKECKLKATTPELIEAYKNIKESLDDFDMITPIYFTFGYVVEFVKLYNSSQGKETL